MAGEYAPSEASGGLDTLDVNGAFEQIVRDGLDEGFRLDTAEIAAQAEQLPFGLFTEPGGVDRLQDTMKAAMKTSTGYTGNNTEEET